MAQPKRTLAVGERGYLPPNSVCVHRPGDSVHVHRRYFVDAKDAGTGAVTVERVSADVYRVILPAGFRVTTYSESASHTAALQPVHEVVDEQGSTHTTMPSKYLTH